MTNGNGSIWKLATTLLAGGLMGTVFTNVTALRAADVNEIVKEAAPWMRDKAAYELRLNMIEKGFEEQRVDLRKIHETQDGMNGRLDALLVILSERNR